MENKNNKIVSIHQPAYLPWLGYLHKIMISDEFVFFDTTQFEKNSFVNRNKVNTLQGATMLTVPVRLKNHFNKEIKDIEITNQKEFGKHWKTIELNYKKSPYWDEYSEKLKEVYNKEYKYLSDLCFDQLICLLDILKIDTKIIKSSELRKYETRKSELVLDLCRDLNAGVYISGKFGKDYLDEKSFEEAGIKIYFQDYKHPVYKQMHGEFVPYLAIIDLLFNVGAEIAKETIMEGNITKLELEKRLF